MSSRAIAFSMTPPHVVLASRQRADGSWSLDDVLSRPLGIPQQRLATVASELQVALGVNGDDSGDRARRLPAAAALLE